MKAFWIDPPTGWAHGFPAVVSEEILNDPEKLKAFVLKKGYPEKDWVWAQNHVRVWAAKDMSLEFCPHCGAGVGKFRREGEGTCQNCPEEVLYKGE